MYLNPLLHRKFISKFASKFAQKLVLFSQPNFKVINAVFEGHLKKLTRNSQQLCELAIPWLYLTHLDE